MIIWNAQKSLLGGLTLFPPLSGQNGNTEDQVYAGAGNRRAVLGARGRSTDPGKENKAKGRQDDEGEKEEALL